MIKVQRGGSCSAALTLSRRHGRHPAAVRRVAGDPALGDHGRAVAVVEEAGVRLAVLQHRESGEGQRHLAKDDGRSDSELRRERWDVCHLSSVCPWCRSRTETLGLSQRTLEVTVRASDSFLCTLVNVNVE